MNFNFSKNFARILSVIIAALLLLGTFVSVLANAAGNSSTIDEVNSNISSLEKELAEIVKQKAKYEEELKEAKSKLKDAMSIKKKYDDQMNVLQSQIDTTQSMIDEYNRQISYYNAEISSTEESINEKLDLYYARARANFENGKTSYLEILFSSDNISDFLARLEVIESITAADNAFIASLRAEKQTLEEFKASLEKSKAEQQTLLNGLNDQRKQLKKLVDESGAMVAKIEDGIDATVEQIEDAEKAWKDANDKLEAEIARKSTLENFVGGSYLWPTPGIYKITSKYGWRIHPTTKKNSFHYGVDIAAPMNTPILAANSGKVLTATKHEIYGNYVVIDHGGGSSSLYAHMTKYTVKVGQTVSAGDVIGYVGSTGWSTGAHLHFEIREKNTTTDPLSHYPNIKFIFV